MRILHASLWLISAVLHGAAPQKVILIGIDGLSSEGLQRAQAPNLRALMRRGSWTLKARAVLPTSSSPNWASILMGAGPEIHGVTSNDWQRDKFEIAPACLDPQGDAIFPTIVGQLRAHRPNAKIAAFYHWADFGRLIEKNRANLSEHLKTAPLTAAAAIAYWKAEKPDLLLIHFDEVDHMGHEHGWGSPEYLAEIERSDELVGRIAAAVGEDGVILVVSDHGGIEKKHGGGSMAELETPWIAAGRGIVANREIEPPVSVTATAPTVVQWLGIPPHPCWTAKPLAIFTAPR